MIQETALATRKTNKDLLFPYAVPYLVYTGLASLPEGYLPVEWNYALRLLIVPVTLFFFWNLYMPLTGPNRLPGSIAAGVGGGIAGTVLWVMLVSIFVGDAPQSPWSDTAFALRLAASGLLVPVFEELLMRGYVLRLVLQWENEKAAGGREPLKTAFEERSVNYAESGSWSVLAVIVSSIVFALGHDPAQWVASIAYGLLMSSLYIFRKDLISCVVAHATTNIALALYIRTTGNWSLW